MKNFLKSRTPNYPLSLQATVIGLFSALTIALTIIIQIPVPATGGYINIGDAAVMLSGLLFGPIVGGVAGGLGSALADIITGYAFYSPWTLIIKGVEGFLAGLISRRDRFSYLDLIACFIIAGPWMITGYFMVESLLFSVAAAIVELPLNVLQFTIGGLIATPVSIAARKVSQQLNTVKDR
ncbi:MAG: ECF transporter S component [Candidatus Odinarchaeum yellowstonii]|uniref:ECF transporter S component n=1 Tax=Odinarchaeota yellowstonii (strain LCB_4) TaxID=1841599 RepID=A0AAF0D3Z9_ODILC|nr:MAG: ECF transporter S component [Candidatus Odinarchaeum yellowstonii]